MCNLAERYGDSTSFHMSLSFCFTPLSKVDMATGSDAVISTRVSCFPLIPETLLKPDLGPDMLIHLTDYARATGSWYTERIIHSKFQI